MFGIYGKGLIVQLLFTVSFLERSIIFKPIIKHSAAQRGGLRVRNLGAAGRRHGECVDCRGLQCLSSKQVIFRQAASTWSHVGRQETVLPLHYLC